MPVETYRLLHLFGIMTVYLSLGMLIARSWSGAEALGVKKFAGMLNGIGLLVSLVAGFGLLAKLGLEMQGWVLAKFVIWIALGGFIAVANRKPEFAKPLVFVALALGATAAFLAGAKPF